MADNLTDVNGNALRSFQQSTGEHLLPSFRVHPTNISDGANTFSYTVAAALSDGASNPTLQLDASCLLMFNGSTWDRVRGDTTNGIDVDVTRVSGTVTVDGSGVTQPVSIAQDVMLGTDFSSVFGTSSAVGTAGSASSVVLTVQGIASMTPMKVDGSGVTQPVSVASLPLPSGAATSANQATANSHLSTIAGGIISTADLDTGAGTDTKSAVGLLLAESGGGVEVGSANPMPVSGAVTANAGTNLNTSALALESGGNLASIAGAIHAEDAAHSSGHSGVFMLGVRNENDTTFVAGPNDYTPIAVTSAGFTLSADCHNEGVAHSDGAWGSFVLTVRKDSGGSTAGSTGDYAALTTDSGGNLWVRDSIAGGYLATIDADTSNMALSLAAMDDWDDGSDH